MENTPRQQSMSMSKRLLGEQDGKRVKSLTRKEILRRKIWQSDVVTFCMPMVSCMIGMWFQLAFEHFATYKYVQKYAKENDPSDGDYRMRLQDEVQDWLFPKRNISMGTIDKSAYVPAMIFALLTAWMVYKYHMNDCDKSIIYAVWTKVCVMWSVLAVLKGILDSATVIPDSMGWKECRDVRLKTWGVDFMRGEQPFWRFLVLDFMLYFWSDHTRTPPLRLCCDMMLSGHTFTVVVFGLGVYELARIATGEKSKIQLCYVPKEKRVWLLTSILVLLVLQQGVEIYAVQSAHFHYTVDILVAVVLSFLVWTNVMIPHFAKQWALRSSSSGEDSKEEFDLLNSAGDVFIPVCMWPFCPPCLTGSSTLREHFYKDHQVRGLIRKFAEDKHLHLEKAGLEEMGTAHQKANDPIFDVVQKCERRMNMDESISLIDIVDSLLLKETFVMDYLKEDPKFRILVRLYHRKWITSEVETEYAVQIFDRNMDTKTWDELKGLDKSLYPLMVHRKVTTKTELREVVSKDEIKLDIKAQMQKPEGETIKISAITILTKNVSFATAVEEGTSTKDTVTLRLKTALSEEIKEGMDVQDRPIVQVYYDFPEEAPLFKRWWLGIGRLHMPCFNRGRSMRGSGRQWAPRKDAMDTWKRWKFRFGLLPTFNLEELWNDLLALVNNYRTEVGQNCKDLFPWTSWQRCYPKNKNEQKKKENKSDVEQGTQAKPEARIPERKGKYSIRQFWKYFVKPMWYQFGITVVLGLLVRNCQLFCYALGTYFYVHRYKNSVGEATLFENDGSTLVDPFRDAIERWSGHTPGSHKHENETSSTEDLLVLGFFVCVFLLTYMDKPKRTNALQVLNKVVLVVAFMLPLNSVLSLVTTIPDASGFQACKDKLEKMKDTGDNSFYDFFKVDHQVMDMIPFVRRNSWSEFRGASCGTSFSDLLGLTIVVYLANFELGLFLMKWHPIRRVYVVLFFSLVSILMVTLRVWHYETNNMHYTMEWIMNIVLAFLFYSNGAVTIAAKAWAEKGRKVEELFEVQLHHTGKERFLGLGLKVDEDGVVRMVEADSRVHTWNLDIWHSNPDLAVCVGDKLVKVNDKTDLQGMIKECETHHPLDCQFARGKQVWMFQTKLRKTAEKHMDRFEVHDSWIRSSEAGQMIALISETKIMEDGTEKLVQEEVIVIQRKGGISDEKDGHRYRLLPKKHHTPEKGEIPSFQLDNTFAAGADVKFFLVQEGLREKVEELVSAGDVLIPPCCFPFCCYWGRFHIYHDEKVFKFLDAAFGLQEGSEEHEQQQKVKNQLMQVMNCGEGISLAELTGKKEREDFVEKKKNEHAKFKSV